MIVMILCYSRNRERIWVNLQCDVLRLRKPTKIEYSPYKCYYKTNSSLFMKWPHYLNFVRNFHSNGMKNEVCVTVKYFYASILPFYHFFRLNTVNSIYYLFVGGQWWHYSYIKVASVIFHGSPRTTSIV